jgi:sugar phosphate isomerase/epimerase
MKLGLINSAWAQAGQDTAFGIRMTREVGFDSIDIFADPLDDADEAERALIRRECDRAGLPIVSVACVALGLIDFNPSVRRFHLDRCRAYLDMARQFEAKNLLLVLGEYVWQKEVIPPRDQWRWGVETVRAIGERAGELGLEVAMELEPFALSLLRDVAGMARFLDEVGLPSVKANLDISHLVLAGEPAGAIEALRGKVAHVHISDCDGKVHGDLPPGRGVVDFAPFLAAIKALDLGDRAISIELEYSPEPDRIGDWVREAYDATDRLMRTAGLRP